jgi:polyhydroxybutyrate depolymerase
MRTVLRSLVKISTAGAAVVLTALASAPVADAAPVHRTLQFGGHERSYLVDVPAGNAGGKPLPLVLVFHGGTLGSAAQAERSYGFRELAEQKNFLAVFPDGLDHHWNDGRDGGLERVRSTDDVGFVAALLDQLAADYRIDPKRVYATGISNGAMLSYALAAKFPARFAAIGVVAGALAEPLAAHFALSQPVAVIAFNGTADKIVPPAGGTVLGEVGGQVLSVTATLSLFIQADGCAPDAARETLPAHEPPDGTTVQRETHAGGRAGTAVVRYTIEGGGHTWPGGPVNKLYTAIAGPTTATISATPLIWDFFAAHPKP